MDEDILERLRKAAIDLVETDGVGDIGVLETARIEIEWLRAELARETDRAETVIESLNETRNKLEAERASLTPAWQPIATAPKDGTPFIGWIQSYFRGKGGHAIVLWHGGDWWDEKGWKTEPACWQPLPTPPVNRPGEPAGEANA